MAKQSAGILMYRFRKKILEVFLVHPGGPFWKNKDEGAWSIPKGEFPDTEDPLNAAKREFEEETGFQLKGRFIELESLRQSSRKVVHAWAVEGDIDPEEVVSNTFEMEWPPKSGKTEAFPEVDRAAWYSAAEARKKLHKGQAAFITRLLKKLNIGPAES